MGTSLFALFFIGGCVCTVMVIVLAAFTFVRKRKYGRISSSVFFEKYANKIYKHLAKNKYFVKVNNEIAYKISVFNAASFEKNRQISVFLILGFVIIVSILSIMLICIFRPYWYIAFLYIVFICASILFLSQLISDAIMNKYLKRLPEAIKILLSRFLTKGSISKAIQVSIPDLPSGIKDEMIRIYDAIKQNETEKTKEVFWEIDRKYKNEHMSVLLDLIRLAHYNGGTESVKMQFDAMIKDILEDLENQQDLRGAAISYIIMSVIFMGALPIVKLYNSSILSSAEMQYYNSRGGMLFAAAYIGFLFIFIAILFYLKKKG